MKSAHHRGAPVGSSPTLLWDFTPGGLRVSPELTIAKTPTVAGRQLCVMGKRAACAFGLNAVSIARHIVRKQKPSCRPAPTVCAGKCRTARSCLALRSPTCSLQRTIRPGTQDHHYRLATRSAGDEEVTTSSPGVRWLRPPAATPSTGWRLCVERAHRACRQATC